MNLTGAIALPYKHMQKTETQNRIRRHKANAEMDKKHIVVRKHRSKKTNEGEQRAKYVVCCFVLFFSALLAFFCHDAHLDHHHLGAR